MAQPNDEAPFINAIHDEADPATAYLIYADWLDENGHAARAEFLRLSVELADLWLRFQGECNLKYVEGIARDRIRLRDLCELIAPDWIAQVHRGKPKGCDYHSPSVPECPSRWESLGVTHNPLVRHCDACQADVYLILKYGGFPAGPTPSRRCVDMPFI